MLIRTNSIVKLDLIFTTHNNMNVNSMNTNIVRTDINIQTKDKNDSQPARTLTPDKQGSSFICCTDQDEEDETQAQTTSFSCSSSSSSPSESISSKTTITNNLGIHQYASTNCTDASTLALVEQRVISYQSNDDNEENDELNHDWIIQDAEDSDAADYVDQGSPFVSSVNLNQNHTKINQEEANTDVYKKQQEEWFKGTLFYDDPGTPPMLPPKDYITIDHIIDL
jgi:hypothetical protein